MHMKSDIVKLFQTAIGAVDPYTCIKHYLDFSKHSNTERKELNIGDNCIILNHNLYVAAFGKAALGTHKFCFIISTTRINHKYFILIKECVELSMKFIINILFKALRVFLVVQLSKLKGKICVPIDNCSSTSILYRL